jgi:hypothetical protein
VTCDSARSRRRGDSSRDSSERCELRVHRRRARDDSFEESPERAEERSPPPGTLGDPPPSEKLSLRRALRTRART